VGLFSKKKSAPPLTDPQIRRLLHMATADLNYGAVQDLHRIYDGMAPADQLWTWWLDQAEAIARSGNRELAAIAVDFARKANVEPWGPVTSEQYDRMRAIEAI
jgi:hypothetical protein